MATSKQHDDPTDGESTENADSDENGVTETLEEAIAKLTPEQAAMFMRALNLTMKKRKLMLMGTLLSLFIMVAGTIWAFVAFTHRSPGMFMSWVFLVPFGTAGFCMWLFGRLAKRAGTATQDSLVTSSASTSGPPQE